MEYKNMFIISTLFVTLLNSGTCWQYQQQRSYMCYHCGSETDTGLDFPCEKFKPDRMFEGPCGRDSFCVKTVKRSGYTVRGCAMKNTIIPDYEHEPGCIFTENRNMTDLMITCFCDEPLCNRTTSFIYDNVLLINLFTIIFLYLIL